MAIREQAYQGPRPDIRSYGEDIPGFVAAMRAWLGLTYAEVEERSQRGLRSKRRKRSINFWYRLEKGNAKLKPQIVDAMVSAFDLNKDEAHYLQELVNIQSKGGQKRDRKARGRALLRMLKGSDEFSTDQLTALQALLNPFVLAIYGLAQRMNVPLKNDGRYLAKRFTTDSIDPRSVEKFIEQLVDAGLLKIDPETNSLQQVNRGEGIEARALGELPGSAKSQAMKLLFSALDDWGAEALFTTPARYRNYESITVLTDATRLEKLNGHIRKLWEDFSDVIEREIENPDGDVVIHVGVRSWPMISLKKLKQADPEEPYDEKA